MVKTQLTPELIEEGRALVEGLDSAGVSPAAALWFLFSDIGAWKLLLGGVKVGAEGPREVYRKVQKTLQSLRARVTQLSLDDIAVAKPDASVLRLLSMALSVGPGLAGVRFTRNVINGTLIEDAYIYRLKRPLGSPAMAGVGTASEEGHEMPMGEFVKGLEQFQRKLQQVADNAKNLDGLNRIPLAEAFPADFMRQHTRVASFEQLVDAGGFGGMDFAAIPDEAWEATVRAHTSFASWMEMQEAAAAEWAKKKLLEGLP